MKIEKFAAIDIGSNAIRLLISNVIIKKGFPIKFIKSSIVRVPIRLGQESFTIGEISSKNIKKIIQTIRAFKHIIKVNEVKSWLAFATSALREANNSKEIIQEVKKKTKLKIEINFEGNELSEAEKQSLKEVALNCPVAKSLHPDLQQEIEFNF